MVKAKANKQNKNFVGLKIKINLMYNVNIMLYYNLK